MSSQKWWQGHRADLGQFLRFALVGGSGVVINLLVAILAKKLAPLIWPTAEADNIWWDIPWVSYNIRWYHIFSMVAFLVANLSNYQLNRLWTFKAILPNVAKPGWWSAFKRFFLVGLAAQLIGLGLETLLMHANSPLRLPSSVFDDSTGFRTRWYWAHLIMILVTVPVSFLLNKFWTFRQKRPWSLRRRGGEG